MAHLFVPTEKRIPHFLRWWLHMQQQGKIRYIIRTGLGFVPGFLFLFIGLQIAYSVVFNSLSLKQSLSPWLNIPFAGWLIIAVSSLLGGMLFGWGMWRYNQHMYEFLLKRKQ